MNVLLINPPAEMLKQEGFGILPPLGLLYIGAVLEEANHEVRIVDCVAHNWSRPTRFEKNGEIVYRFDVDDEYFSTLLSEFKPDFVGIANLFATTESICVRLAEELKTCSSNLKIVIGGTNASARYRSLLQNDCIDFVVLGEGEYLFKDLIDCVQQGKDIASLRGLAYKKGKNVVVNPGINWIENLDELPFPAYHLLTTDIENYFQGRFSSFFVENRILTITTSRGCVRNCVFCPGMKYLGPWRGRSPENVLREAFYLRNTFGVKEVAFVDANINLDKRRFVRIMELMVEQNLGLRWTPFGGIYVQTFTPDLVRLMKETGCHSVNFAVEHGNNSMQKYIGKIIPLEKMQSLVRECKERGMWSHGYFVLGLPGETEKSLKECLDYAKKTNFDSISFFIGTPLPGSRYYEEMSERLRSGFENLRFTTKNIWWTDMDPKHLTTVIKKFMVSYMLYKVAGELEPRAFLLRLRAFSTRDARAISEDIGKVLQESCIQIKR